MNIFIYDDYLNHRKYENRLSQIETRITDLGLNGKIIRLGLLKNIFNAIDDELKRGAKTIIAVGNNSTLNKTINSLAKSDIARTENIPVGIIPIDGKNDIAEYFGIKNWQSACDVLSARRLEKLNIGKINEDYFTAYLTIPNKNSLIEIDKKYTIESDLAGKIFIINFNTNQIPTTDIVYSNPADNQLELFIVNNDKKNFFLKTKDNSLFPFKKIIISNKKYPIIIDGVIEKNTPVEILTANKKISFIVGKERGF
jgi:diacylglycerol kinase family enzyme